MNDYRELTAAQMASRVKRRMTRRTKPARNLKAACEELEWSYDLVYQRLDSADLLNDVMAAKYGRATEVVQ